MPAVQKGWRLKIGKAMDVRITVKGVFFYCFMIAFALFMLLPLVYVVCTALKPMDELFLFPPRIFVKKPTLDNFQDLVQALSGNTVPFLRYVYNSLVSTIATVFFTIIVSCMGAYAIVKIKVPGSKFFSSLIIAALMFSTHVTQIPTYLIVNELGLVDSLWALIIPKIAVPMNLFLIQQFIGQLPDPLLEAAKIDGANQWTIFWKIVMPFLAPAWSTLMVFSFVSNWNDYISPLIFLSSEVKKTLPLALQSISSAGLSRSGATAVIALIMTLPTVLIYVVAQKKVIQTMAHSGIKA